jgi:hypothetical protein
MSPARFGELVGCVAVTVGKAAQKTECYNFMLNPIVTRRTSCRMRPCNTTPMRWQTMLVTVSQNMGCDGVSGHSRWNSVTGWPPGVVPWNTRPGTTNCVRDTKSALSPAVSGVSKSLAF